MKKITQKQIEKFKFLIEEKGYTQQMAALEVNIPPKSVTYYIKTRNIKVKNKFRHQLVNDEYFNIINTENKAYILGFFLADGYISKDKKKETVSNRICFNNSIDDYEIIEKIKNEISPNSNILIRNKQLGAKHRKVQLELRITSNELVNCLENKYNILRAKTYNENFKFNFNNIPSHLIRHFIRGYFDGDGSVSFYLTKNTIYFNFSFIFNSLEFTNQIGDIFQKLFNIKPFIIKNIGKTANWWSMRFNYNRNRTDKIKEIYNYFYKDSSIFLYRKKEKFEKYLEYRAN